MSNMRNVTAFILFWILFVPQVSRADREVVAAALLTASLETGVDHDLLQAIAVVESGRNPRAVGALGEVGLFQLRPEYFGAAASPDPAVNATAAAKYLARIRTRCERVYGRAWFVCFNTGPNRSVKLKEPKQFAYYKKVMAAKAKIKQRALVGQP